MRPILPKFKAQNGQCVPAMLALFFNDETYLKTYEPRKYGYLMCSLNLIANTNIIFDCLSKGSTSHISEKIKQLCAHYQGDEDNVIPLFMELKHESQSSHAILSLLFPKNGKIFFYDLLNGKCGQITLENATFEKTISVWGMVEPFTNSLLGINISELKHLIQ